MSKRESVLSGMRPTGALHIGHYHGALKNWVRMQEQYDCYFFAADWHALTTHYESVEVLSDSVWDMFVDWFAAGIDPAKSTVFIQSRVPQHAELFLLLAMATPLGWLERVPTYKDQIEKLKERDLSTYGFLGYPLMQAADILIYRATKVPVGEDQVPHIEMTREIARRFNHLFGAEPGFEAKALEAATKLGKRAASEYLASRTRYQQQGDRAALAAARALIESAGSLSALDRERLLGYLEGARRAILVEPAAVLTETPKVPGTDGQKMSKSYGNAVLMREEPKALTDKIRRMATDPARVRRSDPGEPERCPVWQLHQVYSDEATKQWVQTGCRTAGIGCLECKQPVIDAMAAEQAVWRERAQPYLDRPQLLREIVADGCERARRVAEQTMVDVRAAMGLAYT
ncbi:MAG TPA: tryptophan--tRNA ligase [Burkholderiaceae bacterium]|nr:tryptophan--tRNA ligase [Burkholderiaceae bacterium]